MFPHPGDTFLPTSFFLVGKVGVDINIFYFAPVSQVDTIFTCMQMTTFPGSCTRLTVAQGQSRCVRSNGHHKKMTGPLLRVEKKENIDFALKTKRKGGKRGLEPPALGPIRGQRDCCTTGTCMNKHDRVAAKFVSSTVHFHTHFCTNGAISPCFRMVATWWYAGHLRTMMHLVAHMFISHGDATWSPPHARVMVQTCKNKRSKTVENGQKRAHLALPRPHATWHRYVMDTVG